MDGRGWGNPGEGPGAAGEDEYGESPMPAGVCWAIIKSESKAVGRNSGDAGLRRRRKNTNTPKAANPKTAPLTLPAITPASVFLAVACVLVELLFVLDVVKVGTLVGLEGLVDSGPSAFYQDT